MRSKSSIIVSIELDEAASKKQRLEIVSKNWIMEDLLYIPNIALSAGYKKKYLENITTLRTL